MFWLVAGATALGLASAKLAFPGLLTTSSLAYPKLMAVASMALQYGWLTLAALAAIFYIVPRLTGAPIRSEMGGQVAGIIINLTLLLAIPITLAAGVSDHEFTEMPPYLDVVLILALALAAGVVFRTIARRTERRLYASVWFFVGALIWGPLAIAVGNLHGFPGTSDVIAHLFSVASARHLFFGATMIGAAYYVVPRASGSPLYSHRLALIGFWVLALAAPLSGGSLVVGGPLPDWLETISIAASIALLVVGITVAVNIIGTLRGAWKRVPDHPSVRFFLGGLAVWGVALVLDAVSSFRLVAASLGATEAVPARIWLFLLAMSLWAAGVITYALPKLMGKKWTARSALTASFWLILVGSGGVGLGSYAAGFATAAVTTTGAALGEPVSFGAGFVVVLTAASSFRLLSLAGYLGFLVASWMFAVVMLRSTVEGEPQPIEVVAPPELVV